jgi:hypothetical protein
VFDPRARQRNIRYQLGLKIHTPGRTARTADRGADWEPGWRLNLQAGSAATVEVDGVRTPVTGPEITGSERETLCDA